MRRPSRLPAVAVILSVVAGLASARIEEPRYALTGLRLEGPATIPNGESGVFRLVAVVGRVARDAPSPAGALTLTDRVRPELAAGAARLASGEIEVGRLLRAGVVELTLSCVDHEVRGSGAGSGAGARARSGRMGLPWFDQPATVRARIGALESNAVTILCEG